MTEEKQKKPVKRVSYSLEDSYQELFKAITGKTGRSLTNELRIMLDARAATLGLTPIKEVDPKSSASHREDALLQPR